MHALMSSVLGLVESNFPMPPMDGEISGCLCAANCCKPGIWGGFVGKNLYACVRLVLLIGRMVAG